MSPRAVLFWATALLLVGCGPTRLHVPGTLSPAPQPGRETLLRAGFARVDITPPPGVGLAGNGPEGAEARGYRLRLYARVLVLADGGGNRVALVVADLGLSSTLLHRRVAALTARTDGIGVDRLVIAVTHTHAGPGHYFEAAGYNDAGSSVLGYDPVIVDSLTVGSPSDEASGCARAISVVPVSAPDATSQGHFRHCVEFGPART